MNRARLIVLAAAAITTAIAGSSTALSQEVATEKTLSLHAAQEIAQGAIEKCREGGYKISVTVLDANGFVKVYMHDEGANIVSIDGSKKKAYTALNFKRSSGDTGKALPPGALASIEGTSGLAGGLPIKVGDEVIGAVGVGGAPGGDKDEACASAGLAKVAEKLK